MTQPRTPPLDHPSRVALLLKSLWQAGAHIQVGVLANRAAAAYAAPSVTRSGVARLLGLLRQAGAHDQAAALADRAAAHAPLDDPGRVALLLDYLWGAGAYEQ